jgi:hypothetical protein
MKRYFLIFLLVAVALAAADKPRVSRVSLVAMEKSLDQRVSRLWGDNPFVLLGPTRGIYLEGYGAVFTTEIDMVAQPTSMMNPVVTKQDVVRHHQKKLERVPQLKAMLREALCSTAASLDTVPAEEQITIVAFLNRYPWEDMTGLPVQVMMQAPKKRLLEAQRSGASALEAAIRVTEY